MILKAFSFAALARNIIIYLPWFKKRIVIYSLFVLLFSYFTVQYLAASVLWFL